MEAPSQSTEARVVRLSSGPPSIPKKGGKVQIRQEKGAQDIGAAPDSPELPVVRQKTPSRQGTPGPTEGQAEPKTRDASFLWSQ